MGTLQRASRVRPWMRCVLLALLGLQLPLLADEHQSRSADDWEAIYASYSRGQFEQMDQVDFGALSSRDLARARDAVSDTNLVSPAAGAGFLLELARGYSVYLRTPDRSAIQEAGSTLEAACELARDSGNPAQFIDAFQSATLALLGGRGILRPSPQFDFGRHVRHIEGTEVSPGEVLLVEALAAGRTASRFLEVERPALENARAGDDPTGLTAMALRNPPHRNRWVVEALDALGTASAFADVRAEAMIRSAVLKELAGQPSEAVRDLELASTAAPDARQRYLIAFIHGRIHENLGQVQSARALFGRALAEYPSARSARLAMAANLYMSRLPTEPFLTEALAPDAALPLDPWEEFSQGLGWLWPARRTAMREAMQ